MNRTKSASAFAVALLLTTCALSQNGLVFVNPVDTVVGYTDVPEDSELSVHLDVENTGEDTLILMATRLFVDTVSPFNLPYVTNGEGAYERFCWGPLCYNYGTTSSSQNAAMLVTLAPGAIDSSFVADYYFNGVLGTTTMRYCLHGVGEEPESGACHDLTFTVEGALSVPSVNAQAAIRRLSEADWQYDMHRTATGTFRVLDLQGRVVHEVLLNASSGQIHLPHASWPAGIYVVALESEGFGRVTETVYFRGH